MIEDKDKELNSIKDKYIASLERQVEQKDAHIHNYTEHLLSIVMKTAERPPVVQP